jgi:hypothetical protein
VQNTITFVPRQRHMLPGTDKFPFDIEVLGADRDRIDVFALRYRAYLDAGYIEERANESYRDLHDDLPTTVILRARDNGVTVGTLRVCLSQPWQPLSTLPCAPYYPALDAIKRDAPGGLAEMSRLAIAPAIDNRSYRTTLYAALVRAGFIAARAASVSHILIATKSEWIRFYRYMLGFEPIGAPALYPPGDIPISLLCGRFADAEKRQRLQNSFFKVTDAEVDSMRAALGPELLLPPRPVNKVWNSHA